MASKQSRRPLPVELWTEVFGRLASAPHPSDEETSSLQGNSLPTLLSLTLVCRLFRRISQPFIFSRFHIDFSKCAWGEYDRKSAAAADRLEQLLAVLQQNPDYRRWIKVVQVCFKDGLYVGGHYRAYLPQVSRVKRLVEQLLLQLMDVQSVGLSGMHISQDLYRHICCIPTLQALHLLQVLPPRYSNDPKFIPNWKDLPITNLAIGVGYGIGLSPEDVDTKALFMLSLGPNLNILRAPLWVLAYNYHLRPPGSWSHVTEVALNATIARGSDQIGVVLMGFPSLRRLSFPEMFENIVFPPFPKECVPNLTDFEGPWRIARSPLPGRPVQKVVVGLERQVELSSIDEMAFLSEIAATVEHLELQLSNIFASREHLKYLATLLPDLESLYLNYWYLSGEDYFDILVDFVSSDCNMPQLKHLHCSTSHPNRLPPEHEEILTWLQISTTAFPSLRTAELQGKLWRQDPGSVGEWQRAHDE